MNSTWAGANLLLWALAIFLVLPAGAAMAEPTPLSDLSIGGYTLVSRTQSGRSFYIYEFRAEATNNGAKNLLNVVAGVSSVSPNVTVEDGDLEFKTVVAGGIVESTDTFKIKVDLRYVFDESNLVFTFSGDEEEVVVEPPPLPPGILLIGNPVFVNSTDVGGHPDPIYTIYEFRAEVTNTSAKNLQNVVARITSASSKIIGFEDDDLQFASVPAGETVMSDDTFKFKLDNGSKGNLDLSDLSFVFFGATFFGDEEAVEGAAEVEE
jgi:hypothetical protein